MQHDIKYCKAKNLLRIYMYIYIYNVKYCIFVHVHHIYYGIDLLSVFQRYSKYLIIRMVNYHSCG